MDITYHYPPDLLQLLIDTIPRLCRGKKDVFLFFRGAGVSNSLYADVERQHAADPKSVNKFGVTRTVLSRLNDAGEARLRERREILKRVIEFEDFSTCWPKDQLEAKGLVAQIQKLVGVKDSFTRMRQEKDAELYKHRLTQEKEAAELQVKNAERETIKKDFYRLFGDVEPHLRGKLLEKSLNRLFSFAGILVRESFTRVNTPGEGIAEQIDGVIELGGDIYLVEMKWLREPVGVADISQHLVRVFNRDASRGIFISYTSYTMAAITTCKEALAKMVVSLCMLDELVTVFEKEQDVKDFFLTKIRAAIIDKEPFRKI